MGVEIMKEFEYLVSIKPDGVTERKEMPRSFGRKVWYRREEKLA
jgi:hypothetical protein